MSLKNLSTSSVIAGGTKILQDGRFAAAKYSIPVIEKSANMTAQAAQWTVENPVLAGAVVGAVVGATVIAAPTLITAPVLSAAGFTPGGIQAGSAAAVVQSSVGNIAAGSYMAIAQSAGAGGSGLAVVNGATQLGAAAVTAGSAGFAWVKSRM
ncbi:hypothetical protein N7520_000151 [Penicillium odoratum]|uniref:uncharacterized protein n=1 Tax=Penicillium odoratum TaxID=1167516 RepID=UPI002546738D|nr:uncharacterized protein N7520_000151 [Penicillium odoratum]KAJ5776905.1 hypothetical protein N7520_000151 [Penicillium odoratum]